MAQRNVEISLGDSRLVGTEDGEFGVKKFLGVPYALPPTGDFRFCRPRRLPTDYRYGGGSLDCTEFRSACCSPPMMVNGRVLSASTVPLSEDCLYLNIWVPTGPSPASGWPVLAWIHGGFYQSGNPLQSLESDPVELISEKGAGLQSIVIAIGYRLNIFGFSASEDLSGNFGLWDQRSALEWINKNVKAFGGDAGNVTLAGISAGANAVHQQINYEFFQSKSDPIFHRAIMYSNAIAGLPKLPGDCQAQFDEVCSSFDIDTKRSFQEKIASLRRIKDKDLVAKITLLKAHKFMPTVDGTFVSPDLITRMQDGRFAAEFKRRSFKLIIGEVENEEEVYRQVDAPRGPDDFLPCLKAFYADPIATSLAARYPFPKDLNSKDPEAWKTHHGYIIAGTQVRASTRSLVSNLLLKKDTGLTTSDVLRYRISLRLGLLDRLGMQGLKGVAHGMCQLIWWYQRRLGYSPQETEAIDAWLVPWKNFIWGKLDQVQWGTTKAEEYRQLHADGTISIEADAHWNEYIEFSRILMPEQSIRHQL